MEKTNTQALTVGIILLSFLSAVLPAAHAQVPPAPVTGTGASPSAADGDPRETYVLLAVLCFNEASGNMQDCKAIGNIRLRYARSEGITLRQTLLLLHTERRRAHPETAALRTDRATNPRAGDARAWLGDVRSDLHQPLGWPGSAASWRSTARVFADLFALTQRIETGEVRDTCEGRPIGWGGPVVDQDRLTDVRLREQGRVRVRCHGTANTYFERAPATPPVTAAASPEVSPAVVVAANDE